MTALLVALVLVLPVSGLLALALPVVVMACCRRWAVPAAALWILGAALLVVWFAASHQDGVRADQEGASGDVFSSVRWLLGAVLSAAGSVAVTWRLRSRRVGRAQRG